MGCSISHPSAPRPRKPSIALSPHVSNQHDSTPIGSNHSPTRLDRRRISDVTDADLYQDALSSEPRSLAFMNPDYPYHISLEESSQAVLAKRSREFKNTYSEPDPSTFLVRGPRYLSEGRGTANQTHLKQPAVAPPYAIEGLSMIRSPKRLECVATQLAQFAEFFAQYPPDEDPESLPSFLVINWIVSSLGASECVFVNHVFKLQDRQEAMKDAALVKAMTRFLRGSQDDKRKHFKFLFKVIDAPSTLKRIIALTGGERPVIIGKQLTTHFIRGRNFLEINCDVSSSKIASLMTSSVLSQVGTLVHEHCWLLEGQREDELPERVLCLLRWNWNHANEVIVNVDSEGKVVQS